jgi:hypothetical protein
LNKLINVLHLIFIRHNLGMAYHLIVQFASGVQCTNNYVEDGKYCVRVILPTDGGSIACDCECTFVEDGLVHDPVCMVKVGCIMIGRLPPLAAPKEFDLNGDVSKRSCLHDIGYSSVVKRMFRLCSTNRQPICESKTQFRTVSTTDFRSTPQIVSFQALAAVAIQASSICNITSDEQLTVCRKEGETTELNFCVRLSLCSAVLGCNSSLLSNIQAVTGYSGFEKAQCSPHSEHVHRTRSVLWIVHGISIRVELLPAADSVRDLCPSELF